jgi:hypothetical protein
MNYELEASRACWGAIHNLLIWQLRLTPSFHFRDNQMAQKRKDKAKKALSLLSP